MQDIVSVGFGLAPLAWLLGNHQALSTTHYVAAWFGRHFFEDEEIIKEMEEAEEDDNPNLI